MSALATDVVTAFADHVPEPIAEFLQCPTDLRWAEQAVGQLDLLLTDHASCELKAASTALALIHRYPLQHQLVMHMSRLAREELRHFEQVSRILKQRDIHSGPVSAAVYASSLRSEVAKEEPNRLVETLIVGAIIEARSCERFALLAPMLDAKLGKFYFGLLASEARHFQHYLELAKQVSGSQQDVDARVNRLRLFEASIINAPAASLRFHSGPVIDGI